LGNSKSETNGPGTRFQIDATIADIYLVSSLDVNKVIGRPVIYAVLDVYSRIITGLYVGLEGPSWIGAMMALDKDRKSTRLNSSHVSISYAVFCLKKKKKKKQLIKSRTMIFQGKTFDYVHQRQK